MLKNIIDLLQIVNGETENIKFAQGSKYLPDNWKAGLKIAKRMANWEINKNKFPFPKAYIYDNFNFIPLNNKFNLIIH